MKLFCSSARVPKQDSDELPVSMVGAQLYPTIDPSEDVFQLITSPLEVQAVPQ